MSHWYSYFSWWWAHSYPNHVDNSKINIQEGIVHQSWFYFQDFTRMQVKKHKIFGTPLAPALRDLNGNEEFCCQQDGTPHIPIVTSGATWLNFQAGCTGRRGSVEYQPRSLDLTPLDFHLLMYVKDAAFLIKPTTRKALREDMEGSWAAIPVYTMFDFSTHSSAEFRSTWMLAVSIAKVCPNWTCVNIELH